MSNLVPELRANKNGVLVTKHVRADTTSRYSSRKVPAPSIGLQKDEALVKASAVQKRWRVNTKKWGACDDELKFLCTERFTAAQTYECSDVEAYDVMSVVHPENALPLLAVGIRSSDNARQFLDDIGLGRLKHDRSDLAESAVERGIPARDFLEFAATYHRYSKLGRFVDAAECWSIPALKQADFRRSEQRLEVLKPLREMILDDEIEWSHIKEIGVKKVADLSSGSNYFVDHLVRLKARTGGLQTIDDMVEVIAGSSGNPSTDLEIADVYGMDGYREIASDDGYEARKLIDALRERDHPYEKRIEIYRYAVRVGVNPEPRELIALYDAGINAEDARQGIIDRLTANQIIGLNKGEVTPTLSSGYL